MRFRSLAALAVVPALLSTGTAFAQNQAIPRYVASDTDIYLGHPDQGGRVYYDRRNSRPFFYEAGTLLVTDGICSDAWCPLTNGDYVWGGDLCPTMQPALPCTDE